MVSRLANLIATSVDFVRAFGWFRGINFFSSAPNPNRGCYRWDLPQKTRNTRTMLETLKH